MEDYALSERERAAKAIYESCKERICELRKNLAPEIDSGYEHWLEEVEVLLDTRYELEFKRYCLSCKMILKLHMDDGTRSNLLQSAFQVFKSSLIEIQSRIELGAAHHRRYRDR